jgi:hypothetical protein
MTMRPVSTTIGIVSAALLSLTVWGGIGLTNHIIIAVDRWGNAAPDLKPTLDAISGPRGTLHEVNKAAVKIGDAIVQTQLVERATTPHVTAAMDQFGMAAQHLSGTADSLKGTADALTGTAKAATVTLTAATGAIQTLTIDARTANDLLVQLKPLIASYTATGNDLDISVKTFNGLMASPNVTIMLANGAQFTTTAVQLEQKLAQCTLHPTLPCVLKSDILFGAQVGGYLLR